MRDGEDGLVPKPLPDGLLQQLVRLLVHAGRGLVDAQELRVEKQRLQTFTSGCDSSDFLSV